MKKKSFILTITCFLLSSTLSSCGNDEPEKPETFHVTFKNYDDSVLYHTKVNYGEKVVYDGPVPEKEGTISHYYEFTNWDQSIDKPIVEDMVFNAQFEEKVKQFKVIFLNYDDTILDTCYIDYGGYATYKKPTPTKESNDKHIEYTFTDWDKQLNTTQIFEDTTFKAEYNTTYYNFAEFYNYDNSLLYTSKVKKGETPSYPGKTPSKPYDGKDNKGYKFVGWDNELEAINTDTKYVAQFNLLNIYTVTFKNYNGNTLYTDKVFHGDSAVYKGSTPSKPGYSSGNYIYTYTFDSWDGSLYFITCDKTLFATFTEHCQLKMTQEEKIINHLQNYGSGKYNNVSTGSSTTLGYKNGYFYIGHTHYQGDMECLFAANFTYGSANGHGSFEINYAGSSAVKLSMTVCTSNHTFWKLSDPKISYNTLPDNLAESVASINVSAAREAVNNATSYLRNNGLGYIW